MFSALLFLAFGSFVADAAVANPDLGKGCGLDFVLVLDRSTSIANAGAQTTVKNAAKAFLNGLVDTGSRAALVSFASSGTIDQTAIPLTSGTNLSTFNTKIDGLSFAGTTNWEDGLEEAQGTFAGFGSNPDLVVMITDGQPNADNGPGSALTRAAGEADTIKTGKTHMFALGVGNVGAFTGNLQAISETEQYPAPQSDFGKADWSVVSNFADLGQRVKDIAISLCGGTVTVEKRVNGLAAEGWEFSSPEATASPRTTAANGFTTFDYSFSDTTPKAVSIQETPQPNYQFVSASCTMNSQTVLSTTSLPLQLNVGPNDKVNCTVNNRTVGTLTVTKDVVGAPDQTFPVSINCSDDAFDQPNAQISEATGITIPNIPTGVTCTVTEAANANFTTAYAPASGQVTIAQGDNAVTITNTRRTGTLTVTKDVVGAPDQAFPVGIACSDNTFDHPNAQISEASGITIPNIPTGVTCTVTEAANANFTTAYAPASGQVTIAQGDNAVTITNTRRTGGIIIRQQNASGMTDEFDYTAGSPLSPSSFLLPGAGNQTFPGVATGTYTVTQNPLVFALAVQPGTFLASISCDDANSTVDLPNSTATVIVDPDETVTCTFANAVEGTDPGPGPDPDPDPGCSRDSQGMRVASNRGPGHGCDDGGAPGTDNNDDGPFDTAGGPQVSGINEQNPAPAKSQNEVQPEAPAASQPVAADPALTVAGSNEPIGTSELPRTGSNLVRQALLALFLIIIGVPAMILGRRRRTARV